MSTPAKARSASTSTRVSTGRSPAVGVMTSAPLPVSGAPGSGGAVRPSAVADTVLRAGDQPRGHAPVRARWRGDGGTAMTRSRWTLIGLLASATFINYLDRGSLGVAMPVMAKALGLDPVAQGI